MNSARTADVRLGIRIEILSLAWMVVEMAFSIGAGIRAGSVLLTAFGIDSLIELVSGGVLLRRLLVESHSDSQEQVGRAEGRATWIIAITLTLLCLYVLLSSVYGLFAHSIPESSPIGIGVSALAVLIMPFLAITKRRISKRIDSPALAGEAANSFTCAYMAGTVLLGLLLNSLLGWWWAEYVAAFLFLVWLLRETYEVFEEARQDHTPV